jgi:hypothetical protein
VCQPRRQNNLARVITRRYRDFFDLFDLFGSFTGYVTARNERIHQIGL